MAQSTVLPGVISSVQNRVLQSVPALSFHNYRLWFVGQLVSMVGSWMEVTAQGFLVYQLTGSPAYLGIVGFAAGVPSWIFMLFGGVVADRLPRRTLLVITQTTLMCFSFVVATLTFSKLIQPWHIVVLAFGVGIANAFDAPARQAFVLELVDREHLHNAIALNSTLFQMATVVGPAVAGVTYALVGPAWCFTINALSFIAVIVALLLMKIKPLDVRVRVKSAIQDLHEGMSYVWHHEMIRSLVLVSGVMSLFGLSFVTLLPAWAVEVLGGDAATNGLLQSARGMGALSGALLIIWLGKFQAKGKLLTIGTFAFPLGVLVFSFLRVVPLSLLSLVFVGWGFMIMFNMLNTLLQSIVTDELRGRVMSVYSLTFFGGMPLGALWAGTVAEHFGEPFTVELGALLTLSVALVIFWRIPRLRALM